MANQDRIHKSVRGPFDFLYHVNQIPMQVTRHVSHANKLIFLFFLSGFSALCYQMVWQRILFATFGINIESVTIIVSLFMFGLGIGSLVGAQLEKYSKHLLSLFILFELLIGLFGLASPSIIAWLGGVSSIGSLWSIALCTYIIFALPTLLMGATLPILVGHVNFYVGHTGKSMGWLYAGNTFGAAAAALATVTVFFVLWGLRVTIGIAACINLATAGLAFLLYRKSSAPAPQAGPIEEEVSSLAPPINASQIFLLMLGFWIGYISLSQELIWYRVLGFLTGSSPIVFGLLLTTFLIGVAFSAIKSSQAYASPVATLNYIFTNLLAMLLVWYAAFPVVAFVTARADKAIGLITGLILTGFVAYLCGGVFPVLCHLLQAKTRESSGKTVGKVYFANVIGATIGPLLTGFVLFEYFSLQTAILIVGLVTAAVIVLLAAKSTLTRDGQLRIAVACLGITLMGCVLHVSAYDRFFERLLLAEPSPAPFEAFKSNRSGIISVADTAVFGNGAYDGRMNLDPYHDTNAIRRAYAIATFHPNPKRILVIGLSGGSWTQVLAFYRPLEEITAVEINKGYLDIISHYRDHNDILHNPKVKLVIDDGRRWLRNHPEEKFDVLVMNTAIHWRSNATNVLSKEFFELCKKSLAPGGFIFVNSTGSKDVLYTAAQVFDYVSDPFHVNMIIAGDTPSNVRREAKVANLQNFVYPDGRRVFQSNSVLNDIASMTYPNVRDQILQQKNALIVTDDNMATEFKRP